MNYKNKSKLGNAVGDIRKMRIRWRCSVGRDLLFACVDAGGRVYRRELLFCRYFADVSGFRRGLRADDKNIWEHAKHLLSYARPKWHILSATSNLCLTVRYGERAVLDAATLAIDEGDRIGLVGRNGCGKTTFLRILAGLQSPDSGDVTRRRDLVVSYLPQDFMLDAAKSVEENIRDGAKPVLDLIAEFESLPHDSKRHEELEHRIGALEGWTLDQRIDTAMSHLNCPAGDRRIETLSGGEKRRVAMCRAIVSLPDFLILDEPTNHLDPESIDWVAEFLDEFHGTFLVVTHDRYFLDRVVKRMVELSDGRFFSHDGNYTDYLLAKAERQDADATIEHKRQMFLKKELAWVRQGPRAQRSKQKDRFERYYDTAAQDGPVIEEDVELCIPPPPQLGNRVVELSNLGMELGGRTLFRGFNFTFENGQRIGVAGRNGLGKTTLLKIIIGELTHRGHGEDRPAHEIQLRGPGPAAIARGTHGAGGSQRRHGVRHLRRRQAFGARLSQAVSVRRRPHHDAGEIS